MNKNNIFKDPYCTALNKIKSPYKSGDYFKFNDDSNKIFCMQKKKIDEVSKKGYIRCFEVHPVSKQRLYPSEYYLFTEIEIANTIRIDGNAHGL